MCLLSQQHRDPRESLDAAGLDRVGVASVILSRRQCRSAGEQREVLADCRTAIRMHRRQQYLNTSIAGLAEHLRFQPLLGVHLSIRPLHHGVKVTSGGGPEKMNQSYSESRIWLRRAGVKSRASEGISAGFVLNRYSTCSSRRRSYRREGTCQRREATDEIVRPTRLPVLLWNSSSPIWPG